MTQDTTSLLGRTLGHIRVVERLAEGGMGAVYVGFDDTLERRVVLKAIRDDLRLNPDAKSRFLREARVLSQLEHPRICRIYDYLEADEGDYLVLELVKGKNLREAFTRGMERAQMLAISRQLLDVFEVVHGQGIIHRDLKPENVMLTPEGDVKVLDFGLARSLEQERALSMDPTVGVDSVPADAAADQTLGLDQPAADSTHAHIGRPATGSGSPYVATQRGTVLGTVSYMSPEQARGEPATSASDIYSLGLLMQEMFTGEAPFEQGFRTEVLLKKAAAGETRPVRGLDPDLTALINRMKALAPGARPSAADAAEHLQRIVDAPRRRQIRRLKAAAWIVLAVFAAGMTVQSIRAARAARRAEAEARRAEEQARAAHEVTGFLVDLFAEASPEKARGETVTAQSLVDRGAEQVEGKFVDQPAVRARLMEALGNVYFKLGEHDRAEHFFRSVTDLDTGESSEVDARVATSLMNLGNVHASKGRLDEADRLYAQALEMQRRAHGPDHPEVAAVLANIGSVQFVRNQTQEAVRLWRESLAIYEAVHGPNHLRVAQLLNNLGLAHRELGQIGEAEAALKRSLSILRSVKGDDHPEVARVLGNLADLDLMRGELDDAEARYRQALAIREKVLGPDHPLVAVTLRNVADTEISRADLDRAEELLNRARQIAEGRFGSGHQLVAEILTSLAEVELSRGHLHGAESHLRHALDIYEQTGVPVSPSTLVSLGRVYLEGDRLELARTTLTRALEASTEASGPGGLDSADISRHLAEVCRRLGLPGEARTHLEQAINAYQAVLGPEHATVAELRTELDQM